MALKKINWMMLGIIGSVSSIVALLGTIFSGLINPKTGALIMISLLCLSWILSVEVRLSRLNPNTKNQRRLVSLPKPIIQVLTKEPIFIHSRDEDPNEEIPTMDSKFLDLDQGTFCIWVKVIPELRKTKKNRYVFSHASNWKDNTKYPNAFCLYHCSTFQGWGLLFHGDPQKEGEKNFYKRFPSSTADDGVHLFSIRWRKKQGEFEVLVDANVRFSKSGFINWPKSGDSPVFLGGWIKGGWDSYIKTKIFNARAFDEWLNEDQIKSILREQPYI